MNVFINLSNEHSQIQCRRLNNKSNTWFDADILVIIHRRDYLKRRDIDPEEMRLHVSYVNANVNITMETINENQSNPNKLWKVLNKLTSKQQRDDIMI